MRKQDYDYVRLSACNTVSNFYKEHGKVPNNTNGKFEKQIVEALLQNKDLEEKGELFLEKKSTFEHCSAAFKQMFKQLDKVEMDNFPNSWIRINLNIEEIVLVVNMKRPDIQPIALLKKSQVSNQKNIK